ncbi:MAG TPA: hypothetical protein VML75_03915, partial [Kofleriaceae bacterium]|nr:hypothetical protein [Kofleriaceae bacterium]
YRFTLPSGANRRARVTVTNAAGFDPVLVLRDGSCTGTELACGQTSTGTTEVVDAPDLPPGDYFVWVDAMGSGGGSFDIVLELMTAVPPPSNDTCTAPDALVAGVVETHSTVGAADDYALACLAFDSRDTTHQIDLASAQATLVTLTPRAPGWQVAAALRAFTDCATGPELSCVSAGGGIVRINRPNLQAGSYALVVDGESGASGDYDVGYEIRPADTTFGYWQIVTTGTFTSIAGTAGATQRTIPLSTTGLSPGDEWSQNLSLPFAFDYYGTSYTSINAHSNTFLTFDVPPAGAESYNNDCPLDSTAPNNLIALFWGDGISTVAAGSEMWTRVDGVMPDRRLIVEYKSWDMVTCSGPNCYLLDTRMSQQAVLYENGDIEFRYGPRTDPSGDKGCGTEHTGCASTIGIEGQVAGATDIDQIECDVNNTTNGRVIYFVHPR